MTRENIDRLYDALETAYSTNASLIVLAQRAFDLHEAALAELGELEPPLEWKLSPLETRIARELAKHRMRSTVQVIKLVYGDEPPKRAASNIYVFVHRLRKKLEPHGVVIDRHERGGYFVTEETLPALRKGFGLDD